MDAAPAAIPVKPNIAAKIAITRKITVQRNIGLILKVIKYGSMIYYLLTACKARLHIICKNHTCPLPR